MAINTSNLYKLLQLNSSMNYMIFVAVVTMIAKKIYICSIIPFCTQHQLFWLDLMNPLLKLKFYSKKIVSFSLPISGKNAK